jgi:hypothetical protein
MAGNRTGSLGIQRPRVRSSQGVWGDNGEVEPDQRWLRPTAHRSGGNEMATRMTTRTTTLLMLVGFLASLTACSSPGTSTPSAPLTPSSGATTAAVSCPQNLPNYIPASKTKFADLVVPADAVAAVSCLYKTIPATAGSLIHTNALDAAQASALARSINADATVRLDAVLCSKSGRAQVVVFARPDGSLNQLLLDPASCPFVFSNTSNQTYQLGAVAAAAVAHSLGVAPQ